MTKTYLSLLVIIIVGIILRLINISPFLFYPDSYLNLILAENILHYHSIVGYLGNNGMLYPDYFMWTRSGLPLLIALFSHFNSNLLQVTQSIIVISSIISIPLAYLFIRSIFKSSSYGLAASFLLALSFNHTVWSGFILTEALGVLSMFIFLYFIFSNRHENNVQDFLAGIVFSFAILTRYEYVVCVIPLIFFLWRNKNRLLIIGSSCLLCLSLAASQLYPIQSTISVISHQLSTTIINYSVFLLLVLFLFIFYKFLPRHFKGWIGIQLPLLLQTSIMVFIFYLLLQNLFPFITLFRVDLTAIRDFLINDILLSIFSVIGLLVLLNHKEYRSYVYIVLFSIFSLLTLYHRVNPSMDRYMTHLIPFLLIPASYGLVTILTYVSTTRNKQILITCILLLTVYQLLLTSMGIRFWNDKSWFQLSYETTAALKVKQFLPAHSFILITSFPESYYYYTNATTYSITDSSPYIYIDNSLNNQPTLIISDMGMRDLFPHFAAFLDTHNKKNIVAKFWIGKDYHYSNRVKKESSPIIIYSTTVGEIKKEITSYKGI